MPFDAIKAPPADLLKACVHCGFCLPTCPTYVLWGNEMDSPRGRIHLMSQVLEGAPLTGAATEHFDSCLSCLGCVTACPSGVRYDELIEATRAQIERNVRRPLKERLLRGAIFAVFPYPRRLRAAQLPLSVMERTGLRRLARRPAVASRLPPLVRRLEALAPPVVAAQTMPFLTPAIGERRGTIGLLTGCVQSVFFPHVNAATARVIAAEGFDVVVPPAQGCCGALSQHAGRAAEAMRFSRKTIDVFSRAGVDRIVVNSAGCGSHMKECGRLLAGETAGETAGEAEQAADFSSRVRDLAEFLVEVGSRAQRHPLAVSVAYHDACHLAHGQGITEQPRQLLSEIPELELRPLAESGLCCGSAGIYNLLEADPADELGDRKVANIAASGAEVVVAGNPGCLMQIRAGAARLDVKVTDMHLAELLDASIQGVPLPTYRASASSRRVARRHGPRSPARSA